MLTLVLGGARSGKSSFAEELACRSGNPVAYVATCARIPGDPDLVGRIERHRADRPAGWSTIEEELDLADAIEQAGNAFVIVDCLTVWIGNLLHHGYSDDQIDEASDRALDAVRVRQNATVAVSNEVGLGIVPENQLARRYRDVLGRVNQRWAAAADRALFLVAGRALPLHDPHELLR